MVWKKYTKTEKFYHKKIKDNSSMDREYLYAQKKGQHIQNHSVCTFFIVATEMFSNFSVGNFQFFFQCYFIQCNTYNLTFLFIFLCLRISSLDSNPIQVKYRKDCICRYFPEGMDIYDMYKYCLLKLLMEKISSYLFLNLLYIYFTMCV